MRTSFTTPPCPTLPNPKLRPETVQDIELVAEQYFGNHLRVTGDIFQNRAHSLIGDETNADGSIQFQNSGSAVARGFETDLEENGPRVSIRG